MIQRMSFRSRRVIGVALSRVIGVALSDGNDSTAPRFNEPCLGIATQTSNPSPGASPSAGASSCLISVIAGQAS